MILEVNIINRLDRERATIEQLHKMKLMQLRNSHTLPPIQKPSHSKTCAFREFRFEPPYVSKKKQRKHKKLPPIPEHMMPKRHNSFEEHDDVIQELPSLPSLSISPAFITERPDERSLSVEAAVTSPTSHLFQSREFTFPETSASRRRKLPAQPSIVPALTPRVRDMPLQAKIEKLAKQKRKERAKRSIEKRYEKKLYSMLDVNSPNTNMAFRPRREPELVTRFHLREQKYVPFKQMTRLPEELYEKPRLNPRLYTKIVDSIYSYTKGHPKYSGTDEDVTEYDRIMVTPVTAREDGKDEVHRQMTTLPPIV